MEDLPIEILSRILGFLNLADRRECTLSCKKFYEASLDPALHWRSIYVFDAKSLLSEDEVFFYCKSPNLFINGVSENLHVKALLNYEPSILGPHVLKLSLKGSALLEGSFVDILRKCEFLEGLDITGCNSLFMPGNFLHNNERRLQLEPVLKRLKDLNVSSIRYLDDRSLRILIGIMPYLESLSLASCNIYFSDFGISQRLALTFPVIRQLVSLRSTTLIRIDLSRTAITNTALQELGSATAVHLREVILQNCREIGDSGIVGFVKLQPSLRVLDLRGCLEIGNQALSGICANLSGLRALYLAKCRKIDDRSAIKILSLEKLCVLDISECYDITQSIHLILMSLCNLTHFIANQKGGIVVNGCINTRILNFSALTKLSINSGRYVTDQTIQVSAFYYNEVSSNMQSIWKSYQCHGAITSLTVACLVWRLAYHRIEPSLLLTLRQLTFSTLGDIRQTTEGLVSWVIQARNTNVLVMPCLRISVIFCLGTVTSGLLQAIPNCHIDMRKFEYQECIASNPSGYTNFPKPLLQMLVDSISASCICLCGNIMRPNELRKLVGDAHYLYDLSGSDLQGSLVEKGIGRLKSLKRLALCNCRNVTDESLVRIFCVSKPLFPNMEHLNLNMMAKAVTDDVLVGISLGCPLLTRLAISCSKIADDGVEYICRRLCRLESLDMSNCDNITSRFFSILAKNNKWLRELDISSCKQIPATTADKLCQALPLLTRVHTRYSGI